MIHRVGRVIHGENDDAPGSQLRVEGPRDAWKHRQAETDRRDVKSRVVPRRACSLWLLDICITQLLA